MPGGERGPPCVVLVAGGGDEVVGFAAGDEFAVWPGEFGGDGAGHGHGVCAHGVLLMGGRALRCSGVIAVRAVRSGKRTLPRRPVARWRHGCARK